MPFAVARQPQRRTTNPELVHLPGTMCRNYSHRWDRGVQSGGADHAARRRIPMSLRARVRLLAQLLRTATWSHLRRHWLRACLPSLGIPMGGTTVLAIARLSPWGVASFEDAAQTLGGA